MCERCVHLVVLIITQFRWVPPTNLNKFHLWFVGEPLIRQHGALAHSLALYNIYTGVVREASERYSDPTTKQQNKHVAKCLSQKYKEVQIKAREKAKISKGISRHPYGENCGRCIGHGYPVSIIVWKRKRSKHNGQLCEVCNHDFNIKGGDRRGCGHEKFLFGNNRTVERTTNY